MKHIKVRLMRVKERVRVIELRARVDVETAWMKNEGESARECE